MKINIIATLFFLLTTSSAHAASLEVMQSMLGAEVDSCPLPPIRLEKICETGTRFFCVDTPPGGTTADSVMVTGVIDIKNYAFAGLNVSIQHEQTKVLKNINATNLVNDSGNFSVSIPLPQLGSYSVIIDALRVNGDSVKETVRISRVVAPNTSEATVEVTPTPTANGVINGSHINVRVDLLPNCENCDFLGSSTGGTTVKIENYTTTDIGKTRYVERVSNIGIDGAFSICVPTTTGKNKIVISACNSASIGDCPIIKTMELQVLDDKPSVVILSPDVENNEVVNLDGNLVKKIPFEFKVEGIDLTQVCSSKSSDSPLPPDEQCKDEIDAPVVLDWNNDPSLQLCPDSDGVFRVELIPHVGVNLANIIVRTPQNKIVRPLTIGWGKIKSPWRKDGSTKPDATFWSNKSFTLGVKQQFLAQTIRSLINNVAKSEGFGAMLQTIADQPRGDSDVDAPGTFDPTLLAEVRAEIPGCGGGGGSLGALQMQVVDPPKIGSFDISQIQFEQNEMRIKVSIEDMSAKLRFFADRDGNALPDGAAMPLKIAFKKLLLEPKIQLLTKGNAGKPIVMLTSETTDCDYKNKQYCTGKPAIIMPKNFVGSATTAGGFAICDYQEQVVSDREERGCKALNLLNAQTGILHAEILDAVNDMLYCSASTALTYGLREQLRDVQLKIPGLMGKPGWELPMGLNVLDYAAVFTRQGMSSQIATKIGSEEYYSKFPEEVKNSQVGYFSDLGAPQLPSDHALAGINDIDIAIGEEFLNQLLFVVGLHGSPSKKEGLLDWDLHEQFFAKELGFNFVDACDTTIESRSALCEVRPRVSQVLGTSLSNEGYLPAKQPLMIRLRGDRKMVPRIRFFKKKIADQSDDNGCAITERVAQFVELQIPRLEVGFYALKTDDEAGVDRYGNPKLQLDASGEPIILPMQPNVSDPLDSPIIKAHATVILALEIGNIATDPNKPGNLLMQFRTNPKLSRFGFEVDDGDNGTLIPNIGLLSAFEQKLRYGVDLYSQWSETLSLSLPKEFEMPIDKSDSLWATMMELVGVRTIRFGNNGLNLEIDEGQDYLRLGAILKFHQQLLVNGELNEWWVPSK